LKRFARSALIKDRWLLSALTFYGDESGSHPHQGAFVLSGYLGWDSAWDELSEQWLDVLHNHGPRIEYFHSWECENLVGQFANFNRPQADRKLNRLIDVLVPFLRRKQLKELTAILEWSIYNRAITGALRREVFSNPYFLLIHALTNEITHDLADRNITEPVWFWMDDQAAKLEYNVGQQFMYVKDLRGPVHGSMLHGLSFRDDKICDPLQCADLIAWQRHHKELNLSHEDPAGRKEWKRLHNAAGDAESKIFIYREDGLARFAQECRDRIQEAETTRPYG
jgi:hypothetical protein